MRGSVFVYSRLKLQNSHFSFTRALPELLVVAATIVVCVDDLVRLWHCGHLSYFVSHFG